MKFYFSGINDNTTFAWLEAAKVRHFLVDHADARNVPVNEAIGILDSGAYKAFRSGTEIFLAEYIKKAVELSDRCEYIVAPDVIGDCYKSFENWKKVKDIPELKNKLIPVWQWLTPQDHLKFYLENYPIVGIGGLAKIFHNDATEAERALREETTALLLRLCRKFPQRFHIFGLNHLPAIESLAPFAYSADSAVWITAGAARSFVIFQHSKSKRLLQAPHRAIPQYNRLDRASRCITNARNIENFLSQYREF